MTGFDFRDRRVCVIGAGLSGISAARLLLSAGAQVILIDGNKKITPQDIYARMDDEIELVRSRGITEKVNKDNLLLFIGDDTYTDIASLDLIVVSPGIALDGEFMRPFMTGTVPVWGEVELAYAFEKGRVLAITGTNGKTTTTALLGQIMSDYLGAGKVLVVGNIGDPYTRSVQLSAPDTCTVAEISSFMLETTREFAPAVSAVLNITEDHLDRHHTMEAYAAAKENIAAKSGEEDFIVLNYEDERCRKIGERSKARPVYFSSQRRLEEGIFYELGEIISGDTVLIHEDEANIVGLHNMENIMAAAAMAIKAGVPTESIRRSVKEFKAVEHRIEFVEEIDGVVYYNDSKGTNPDAAIKGIEAMSRPTVLIAGGYDKGSDYKEWLSCCKGRVKALVLIGATARAIKDCALLQGIEDIYMEDSFESAMERCFALAERGDAVLLSPACASWGMFKNYEERGRIFKELVRAQKK